MGVSRYRSPVERLLVNSVPAEYGDCWIWTGSRNNVGRPIITVRLFPESKPRRITVARFIAQFIKGYRWGKNEARRKNGAHTCHNSQCANPDHVIGSPRSKNLDEQMKRAPRSRGRFIDTRSTLARHQVVF